VIPATANPEHASENFGIRQDKLPNEAFRKRMTAFADAL